MRFIQTNTQAHSRSNCLGISTGKAVAQITLACLACGRGTVQRSRARSPTAGNVLDFNTRPPSRTFKYHYFWASL